MEATWNANCTDHCRQHTLNFEPHPVFCRGGAAWKLPGMPAAQIIAASTHQILKHVLSLVGVELHGSYLEC